MVPWGTVPHGEVRDIRPGECKAPRLPTGGTQAIPDRADMGILNDLELIYHRSWETDVPPLETFTLEVTVK